MYKSILIANRGEIAVRIIKTLRKLGIHSIAVYSEVDRFNLHVRNADSSYCIGAAPASQSYLNMHSLLHACKETGAQAVLPGYGFLSENTNFAQLLNENGIKFIGPDPEHIRICGQKHRAREIAKSLEIPVLEGSGLLHDLKQTTLAASQIGYPVMLKCTAGGGGHGLRICRTPTELASNYSSLLELGKRSFGDSRVFLEKFKSDLRHLEVQIFGDGKGNIITFAERDCSLQRKKQKIVEETPAPDLPSRVRSAIKKAAADLGKSINYNSIGTVEFLYSPTTNEYFFIEINTRIQVEHGITEELYRIDLIEWMILNSLGAPLPLNELPKDPVGNVIEVRINAEDPADHFAPSSGQISETHFPKSARIDSWIETGTVITPYYDSLLAKVICSGKTRDTAIANMLKYLANCRLHGLETNLSYLKKILASKNFKAANFSTQTIKNYKFHSQSIEVIEAGTQTTVQEWPGRLGLWNVGVPPSGPMDNLSFRLLNQILGNDEGTAGLECTLEGPTLLFRCDCIIAIGGAPMKAMLDNTPLLFWQPIYVNAGQLLKMGGITGQGQRTYIALKGGLDLPRYLGSATCFPLGNIGGDTGSPLEAGTILKLASLNADKVEKTCTPLNFELIPKLVNKWDLFVTYGPQGAPDYFSEEAIKCLFKSSYEVHYNNARTGIRLIGPKPEWARKDGGDAGLHPSNIHDNAYAVGAVNFTGDLPIILGPDGPSLGGFVCPITVIKADMWKLGQLKAGDKVSFHRLDCTQANELLRQQNQEIELLQKQRKTVSIASTNKDPSPILKELEVYGYIWKIRLAGDENILVSVGDSSLDLNYRFQIHILEEWLRVSKIPGIIDLAPGVRTLLIHFDSTQISTSQLVDTLSCANEAFGEEVFSQIPSRIIHLPMSWNDTSIQHSIRKYEEGVRANTPWCPSNIEFIRRINGLVDQDEVQNTVLAATYLVLGLGDVYLGSPLSVPLDPRHRLVTTKYNPARISTPKNAVGIGGAYMCIYGMEGPGGYQLVGRTIQVWNKWRATTAFEKGKPWLLRFFDQVKFFKVDEAELKDARAGFPYGDYSIKIEHSHFNLTDYNRFTEENKQAIGAFEHKRRKAFKKERRRWGQNSTINDDKPQKLTAPLNNQTLPAGIATKAQISGVLWRMLVRKGEVVCEGQPVAILESMKMEIKVSAPCDGLVEHILVQPGEIVTGGQPIISYSNY
ncbi:urea carboxylase [Flexibacterium corallicola]|uniref:urea carboxylase n=1 Tax=Flexibacterium corallicola TaxID=3037259 RepID=UPI00286F0DA2|nr:urea carboxylase [Pseudovibrio sp. M1P-2-3]